LIDLRSPRPIHRFVFLEKTDKDRGAGGDGFGIADLEIDLVVINVGRNVQRSKIYARISRWHSPAPVGAQPRIVRSSDIERGFLSRLIDPAPSKGENPVITEPTTPTPHINVCARRCHGDVRDGGECG